MADHDAERVVLSPDMQELKRACFEVVHGFGGQSAAEARFGMDQRRISERCNPRTDLWLPLPWLAEMEALSVGQPGHPHLTRLLARRSGYVLVERGSARDGDGDLMGALAAITIELGDVSRALVAARDDGTICAADARAILTEFLSLEEQMGAMRGALEALADGRPLRGRRAR